MNFSPDYGKTPLTYDEVSALTPLFRRAQREPDKQSIYQIEQSIENAVGEKLVLAVASGKLGLFDLLSDYFLRRLHSDLYGDIWVWAGKYRTRELNIGVAPELIATQVRQAFDNILYR